MWEFRGTVGLGPLLSQAGGLRARAEAGEWMGPEKQSPHLSGRPWTISMEAPRAGLCRQPDQLSSCTGLELCGE